MLTVTMCDGSTIEAPESLAWEARVGMSALEMGRDVTITTEEMRRIIEGSKVVRIKRGQFWRVVKAVTRKA